MLTDEGLFTKLFRGSRSYGTRHLRDVIYPAPRAKWKKFFCFTRLSGFGGADLGKRYTPEQGVSLRQLHEIARGLAIQYPVFQGGNAVSFMWSGASRAVFKR